MAAQQLRQRIAFEARMGAVLATKDSDRAYTLDSTRTAVCESSVFNICGRRHVASSHRDLLFYQNYLLGSHLLTIENLQRSF